MAFYLTGGQQKPRPKKRECLGQAFSRVKESLSKNRIAKVQYITFGGSDFADLGDLARVLKNSIRITSILSFENDERIVEQATNSPIANVLEIVGRRIEIIPNSFPDGISLKKRPKKCQRVFFLDYFAFYDEEKALHITQLLDALEMQPNDWLLITSCLDGRVVTQKKFIEKHKRTCELFFQHARPTLDFIRRNFVDALVKAAVDSHLNTQPANYCIRANLISKYSYADTTPMGVWCFRLEECQGPNRSVYLTDVEFTQITLKKNVKAVKPRTRTKGSGPLGGLGSLDSMVSLGLFFAELAHAN